MAPSRPNHRLFAFGLLSQFVSSQTCGTCESYGLDYLDGGSYFQNTASDVQFTAWEDFSGCQNVTADNFLVDPQGGQYRCNDVPLQPNGQRQLVTCPLKQSQMYSGEWSLVVISDNGACAPIDNIRAFTISAGPQSTRTVPPTVTLTATTTPVVASNVTTTATYTSTAAPDTVTVARAPSATVTRHPAPTFRLVTRGVFTQTFFAQSAVVLSTATLTSTRPCPTLPAARRFADKHNSAVSITLRHDAAPRSGLPHRRHPDPPTTTLVGTGLAPVSVTTTETAPATTVTGTRTVYSLVVTTPTVTVSGGGGGVATVTADRVTITDVLWVPVAFVTRTTTTGVVATSTEYVSATAC